MTYLAFTGNTYQLGMRFHFALTKTDAKDVSDRVAKPLELY